MKFRDPEKGTVFESITDAVGEYCVSHYCFACPLENASNVRLCRAWAQDNPIIAAKVMEYEVIGDAKDTNVSIKQEKPRICEILGVEVGEKFTFTYPHRSYESVSVDADGRVWGFQNQHTKIKIGSDALCWLINHPDSICQLPRLSPAETELARALYKAGAKWACRDRNSAWVYFYRRKPTYVENSGDYYGDDDEIASIYASAFPSVHFEDLLKLEEVCNVTE